MLISEVNENKDVFFYPGSQTPWILSTDPLGIHGSHIKNALFNICLLSDLMQSMDLKTSYMLMGSKHRSLAPASLLSVRLVYGTVYWTSLLGCLIDISSISCHTLNSTSFTLAKFSKWHYQSPSCSGKISKSHPRLLFSLYPSCPVNYPFRLHPKSDHFFF